MKTDMARPANAHAFLQDQFGNSPARANYLCHWSQQYNYVYVETPKVACTTIKRVLQLAEVQGDTQRIPRNVHDRLNSPVPQPMADIKTFAAMLSSPATFKFCFVRNPFTRALSCYLDKFVQNEWERIRLAPKLRLKTDGRATFLEFLDAVDKQPEGERDIHWSAQTYLLRPNRIRYSFVGRFEFFREQLQLVCRQLEILQYADFSATPHATGADKRGAEFFGSREVELIQKIYAADFRNFGYGWSPDVV